MNGVSADSVSSSTLPAKSLASVQSADSSPSSSSPTLYYDDMVLATRTDGRLYLGRVREIEATTGRVLVVFHDGTSSWSLRRHVKKFETKRSQRDNGNVARQSSSNPPSGDDTKDKLPYDINSLHWDSTHSFNAEETYCYCGGPGSWKSMLQCRRCHQWFHRPCLIMGAERASVLCDRWFVFVCKFCNSGSEYLRRLLISLDDFLHLALYNLHDGHKAKPEVKGFSIEKDLVTFLNRNKNKFRFHPKVLQALETRPVETMRQTLRATPRRFRNVSKKAHSDEEAGTVHSQPRATEQHAKDLKEEWALINGDYPPPAPRCVYPSTLSGVVTEETLREAVQPPEFLEIRKMLGFDLPDCGKNPECTDDDDSSHEGSVKSRCGVRINRSSHGGDGSANQNGGVKLETRRKTETNRMGLRQRKPVKKPDESTNGSVSSSESDSDSESKTTGLKRKLSFDRSKSVAGVNGHPDPDTSEPSRKRLRLRKPRQSTPVGNGDDENSRSSSVAGSFVEPSAIAKVEVTAKRDVKSEAMSRPSSAASTSTGVVKKSVNCKTASNVAGNPVGRSRLGGARRGVQKDNQDVKSEQTQEPTISPARDRGKRRGRRGRNSSMPPPAVTHGDYKLTSQILAQYAANHAHRNRVGCLSSSESESEGEGKSPKFKPLRGVLPEDLVGYLDEPEEKSDEDVDVVAKHVCGGQVYYLVREKQPS